MLLIDDKWGESDDPKIREAYQKALEGLPRGRLRRPRDPDPRRDEQAHRDPQRGKNMWVVGLLCALYNRDLDLAKREVRLIFERKRKGDEVIALNHQLLEAGHAWAIENFDTRFEIPSEPTANPWW